MHKHTCTHASVSEVDHWCICGGQSQSPLPLPCSEPKGNTQVVGIVNKMPLPAEPSRRPSSSRSLSATEWQRCKMCRVWWGIKRGLLTGVRALDASRAQNSRVREGTT